jgi:tetratricopeptide (TPR) repeat protein
MENRCRVSPCATFLLCSLLPCTFLLSCTPHQPSQDMVARYLSAKDAYAAGDLQEAEESLKSILARDRRFHQAVFLLGKVYYFQNRSADARRLFTSLLRRHGRYNEAEIWLVRALMQEGATREAKRRVEELLGFDAGDPRLLFLRASLALEEADLRNALEWFERAAGFGDELARTHLEIARLYYQFDLPGRALEELALCRGIASRGSLVGEAAETLLETVRKETEER